MCSFNYYVLKIISLKFSFVLIYVKIMFLLSFVERNLEAKYFSISNHVPHTHTRKTVLYPKNLHCSYRPFQMNEIENKLFYIETARAKITAQFPVRCQKKTFFCFNNIEYLLLCIPIHSLKFPI